MSKNVINFTIFSAAILATFDSRLALIPLVIAFMLLVGSTKPDF